MKRSLSFVAAGLLALSAQWANAGAVQVYVGYADGLRAGADYPNPFAAGTTFGAYNVTNFFGNLSASPDTGAVMIANSGSTDIVVSGLTVARNGYGNNSYSLWSGAAAGQFNGSFVLKAGEAAIFAENNGNNFDASDYSNAAFDGAAETGTAFDASTNNCSTGAIATSTACKNSAYNVQFVLDSSSADFLDTGHVLDTGGFDSANYNHVHTGGNGQPEFNTNESLNWRLIGTTGINDPGGQVPEPASLGLVAVGLLAAAARRRRR